MVNVLAVRYPGVGLYARVIVVVIGNLFLTVSVRAVCRNKGAKTIEAELELALYLAGSISKDNFGNPRKVAWSRAGRTDKGVHAVAQVNKHLGVATYWYIMMASVGVAFIWSCWYRTILVGVKSQE